MTVTDHDVIYQGRGFPHCTKVVREDASSKTYVEEHGQLVVAPHRSHEEAYSVLRLRRSQLWIEVINQADPIDVASIPRVRSLPVRQEHVDPIVDEDADLDGVRLEHRRPYGSGAAALLSNAARTILLVSSRCSARLLTAPSVSPRRHA